MEVSKDEAVSRQSKCEVHGEFDETGFVLPFGERRTIWSGCKSCRSAEQEAEEARRRTQEDQAKQKRIEQRLSSAGIPLRFRDRTFDSFMVDTEEKRAALRIVMEFAEDFGVHQKRGTTVILSGKPGTGKSHLAIAAAMHVMTKSTAMYMNAMDVVRTVRETWRRSSERTETEVLESLASVGLLVIDEIGMQYGSEGEQVILFDVLNRRYRDLMPTILLTNLGKSGMKEFVGERSFDRLREGGIWVAFDWESHRGSMRQGD